MSKTRSEFSRGNEVEPSKLQGDGGKAKGFKYNEQSLLKKPQVTVIGKYRVVIEPDEDGVYVAEVPTLPGCISQGQTRAEAIKTIKEAIAVYLESLNSHGEPVPPSIFEEIVEVAM